MRKKKLKHRSNNIYLEALHYGEEKLSQGVSYDEMIAYLEQIGVYKRGDNIYQFKEWFFLTFYSPSWAENAYKVKMGAMQSEFGYNNYKHDSAKGFLNADNLFQLYDYLELKEARLFSKQAHRTAIVAIIISGFLALGSLLIQLFDFSL